MAVALQLRLLISRLEKSAPDIASLIKDVLDELQCASGELRELARGIHPAVLSERGLVRAVEGLLHRMPMAVELRQALEQPLPEPVEVAFYYLIAESLANACKHSDANVVSVEIGRADTRAWVEVTDDGVGGARASEGSGLGALGDRVEALDGTLMVLSPPGSGTIVRAEVACA